jgi:hypothetical protein
VSAHDLQVAMHAVEQQTPWAQKPEEHSPASEQKAPLLFFPHELCASHVLGGTQSLLVPHEVKHLAPLQTNGAQGNEAGAIHCPVLLQVDGGV